MEYQKEINDIPHRMPQGYPLLVITALLWSTSGVFAKALDWQPMSILAGCGLFTSIVFLLYMRRIPTEWTRWMLLAASGSIVTQFLFITFTKLTTAANAIFLQYTTPIYVVLLAYWLLRENPPAQIGLRC